MTVPSTPAHTPHPPDNTPLSKTCWIIVLTLAAFICLTQAAVMLSMLLGRLAMPAAAPLALALSLLIGIAAARAAGRRRWRQALPALLALAILLAATAFSAFYFDLSWDGQNYHQSAIYALAQDWNVLFHPLRTFEHSQGTQPWVDHYAKGPWYFAAAIFDATGYVEWGKSINLLALAASALALFAAALDAGLTRARAAIIALVLAFNPVVISELTTFLVDAVMAAFLLTTAAAIFSYLRRPRPLLAWIILCASAISINAKFTGLVFLCMIFTAAALWCLLFQRRRLFPFLAVSATALLLGAGVLGYNPYVTNTFLRHNPFYPAIGTKDDAQHDIEKFETPSNLIPHNRFYRLLFVTFGRPGNAPYPHRPTNAQLMPPFAAAPSDLRFYDYHETRVAGFGPWFSGLLILSTLLFLYALCRPGVSRIAMTLVALTLLASIFSSAVFWWPRYGPQFWLLPALPALFLLAGALQRWEAAAAWTLLAGLLANALIVAAVHLAWETRSTLTLRRELAQLAQSPQPVLVFFDEFAVSGQGRMDAWHIPFLRTLKPIPASRQLMSVVEGYPHPIQYRLIPNPESTHAPRPATAPTRP
ncbi:MAG TPA: hypothetical protein VH253_19590 [Phycisphaerae bacterium]|nr:hypothetical protein [Phycisphaerae bacterium]